MDLVELFGEQNALCFSVVEQRATPVERPTSLGLMLAAQRHGESVGLALELALLTGARAVRPLQLVSIGAPTEALISACGGQAGRSPGAFHLEGFAIAERRESSTRLQLWPRDLSGNGRRLRPRSRGTKRRDGSARARLDHSWLTLRFPDLRGFARALESARP